ncbi:MAG: ribosome maturation factor RimM [Bacteroidota bacterium]
MQDLQEIGRIGKPHGLKGEVKCEIEAVYLDDFANAKVLFVERSGQQLPYFVKQIRMAMTPIVALEEVSSKEQAQALRNSPVLIRAEEIQLADLESVLPKYAAFEGFLIVDEALGEIGAIEEILELPQQEMAVVIYKEKEQLIPMNEELILEVDEEGKRLKMELPEGLLEL